MPANALPQPEAPYDDLSRRVRVAFMERIADGGDGGNGVHTLFPNFDKYYKGGSTVSDPTDADVYAHVHIAPVLGEQITLGGNADFRTTGVVMVQVFGPGNGKGTACVDVLVGRIQRAFRSKRLHSIVYRTPTPEVIGKSVTGQWQVNVNIPFEYDERGQTGA